MIDVKDYEIKFKEIVNDQLSEWYSYPSNVEPNETIKIPFAIWTKEKDALERIFQSAKLRNIKHAAITDIDLLISSNSPFGILITGHVYLSFWYIEDPKRWTSPIIPQRRSTIKYNRRNAMRSGEGINGRHKRICRK